MDKMTVAEALARLEQRMDDLHEFEPDYYRTKDDAEAISVLSGVAEENAALKVERDALKEQLRLANIDEFNAEAEVATLAKRLEGMTQNRDYWEGKADQAEAELVAMRREAEAARPLLGDAMTYQEAVKRVQGMVSASAGTGTYQGDAEALAVLRRAEPVMGAVEGIQTDILKVEIAAADITAPEKYAGFLRECLTYKEKP